MKTTAYAKVVVVLEVPAGQGWSGSTEISQVESQAREAVLAKLAGFKDPRNRDAFDFRLLEVSSIDVTLKVEK